MPSLKARVVTATGTRVRNVQVDVKPAIKKVAAAAAKPPPPRTKRRSTNPRFTRTRKTRP